MPTGRLCRRLLSSWVLFTGRAIDGEIRLLLKARIDAVLLGNAPRDRDSAAAISIGTIANPQVRALIAGLAWFQLWLHLRR